MVNFPTWDDFLVQMILERHAVFECFKISFQDDGKLSVFQYLG